jgi:2-hydroxychromene-2-carboxylate isomerase
LAAPQATNECAVDLIVRIPAAPEAAVRLIIYGDFNCPYSYQASQRADALLRLGHAEIDWRAVEHDPRLSMTGTPCTADREMWGHELAEIANLALPSEMPLAAVPPLISNTLAAVSAYAEAVTDGVQRGLRRALFEAIWVRQRHLSSAYDVRSVITSVTYRPVSVRRQLGLELPLAGRGDPDPFHMTRLLGGTIAANGIPLTATGWRRVQQWRREWLALAEQVVPTVIDPSGVVLSGVRGLVHLAELLTDPVALGTSATTFIRPVDGRGGPAHHRLVEAESRARTSIGA